MHRILVLIAASLFGMGALHAAQLVPQHWTLTDTSGNAITNLTDNTPETAATLAPDELEGGLSLAIDLGRAQVLHRVYLTGNKDRVQPWKVAKKHRGKDVGVIALYVGLKANADTCVAQWPIPYYVPNPINMELHARFQPTEARYVRFELQKAKPEVKWLIGEIEIYGFTDAAAKKPENAVVLSAKAPPSLALAAEELRYYLGELSGKPHPIIAPDKTDAYPGTLYRIMDLKPLAKTYASMIANQESGKIPPTPVNVEKQGREVCFRAWPYRNVLWSVWTFLERQGVRWVYPDAQGDSVPAGKGVDLSILPLRYTPSASRIYAKFDTRLFLPKGPNEAQPFMTDGFLYFWRNRWTGTWGNAQSRILGGSEVPTPPVTDHVIADSYKEGFAGYPHNFQTVVPDRILRQHPDWLGYIRTDRFGKDKKGKRAFGPTPCFTNKEMIAWVADKAIAWAELTPGAAQRFDLLPMDSAVYCECEACLALNQPFQKPDIPWSAYPTYYASDAYYHFVCEVAKRVKGKSPTTRFRALAYANVLVPPRKIESFPDNVVVQICQYGAPNLPLSAKPNARMRELLELWAKKCKHLENYDYVLLNGNPHSHAMPLPLVSGIVDRAKVLHELGALTGGTQGSPHAYPYSPWNAYAYAHSHWNVDQSADAILKDFFAALYREADTPMLAFYRTMEEYHNQNELSLHWGGYSYHQMPGRFPYHILQAMDKHLTTAEAKAERWVTKRRLAMARESLDWLLQVRGLTRASLTQGKDIPSLGPGSPPLAIERQTAHVHPNKKNRDDLMLYSDRRLGHHIRFTQAGEYVVRITTVGWEKEKRKAKRRDMVINVEGTCFGPIPVPDGEKAHEITIKVPAGVWEVSAQSLHNAGPFTIKRFTIQPK